MNYPMLDRPYMIGFPQNRGFVIVQTIEPCGLRGDFYGGTLSPGVAVPVRGLTDEEQKECGAMAMLGSDTQVMSMPHAKADIGADMNTDRTGLESDEAQAKRLARAGKQ